MPPESNNYGHSQGKKTILEFRRQVESFGRDHAATFGLTTSINISRGGMTSETMEELNKFILANTAVALVGNMGTGLTESGISYQWSEYPMPLELLTYFQGQQAKLAEVGAFFFLSEDFFFYLHRDGKVLSAYDTYDDELRKYNLFSYCGVMYGRKQLIQPKIAFPYPEANGEVDELISMVETYGLFKFNRKHLRYHERTTRGGLVVRKIAP